MKLSKFIILIIYLFCCNACQSRDTFYTKRVGFDYVRIPLITPYEAILLHGKKSWMMNLVNWIGLTASVNEIKQINVVQNIILIYSKNSNINGSTSGGWFVIIPSKHIEKGFLLHSDYVSFLKTNGIAHEPKLFDINEIDRYYIEQYPLNWQELNK